MLSAHFCTNAPDPSVEVNALLRAYIRATVAKQKDATDAPFAAPEPEK